MIYLRSLSLILFLNMKSNYEMARLEMCTCMCVERRALKKVLFPAAVVSLKNEGDSDD